MEKPIKAGRFKCDIYVATGRFPIDTGDNLTKDAIDGMFELMYKKVQNYIYMMRVKEISIYFGIWRMGMVGGTQKINFV